MEVINLSPADREGDLDEKEEVFHAFQLFSYLSIY